MPRRWLPLVLCCTAVLALPFPSPDETDSEESRKVLGSSVVTSVSVIMDLGNGTKKYYADAAGRPVPKPTVAALVGSPPELLNPDRYEFYTFDESGDLVKRLMTLEEIQSMIANGETDIGEPGHPSYYHQNLPENVPAESSAVTDKVSQHTAVATDMGELSSSVPGVQEVIISVQNVLKEEIKASKNKTSPKPVPFPPSNSSEWNTILPGINTASSPSTTTSEQTTQHSVTQKTSTTETVTTSKAPVVITTKKPVYADNFGNETINILTKVPASSMTSSKLPQSSTTTQSTTSITTTTAPTTTTTKAVTSATTAESTTTTPTTTTTAPATTIKRTTTTPKTTTYIPLSTTSIKIPPTGSLIDMLSPTVSTSKPIEQNILLASSSQISSLASQLGNSESAEPTLILVSSSSQQTTVPSIEKATTRPSQDTTVKTENFLVDNSQNSPVKINIPFAVSKPVSQTTSSSTKVSSPQPLTTSNTVTTTTLKTTTTQASTELPTTPSKLSTWSSVESESADKSAQASITSKPSHSDLNKPLTEIPLTFKNEPITKFPDISSKLPPKTPTTSKIPGSSTNKHNPTFSTDTTPQITSEFVSQEDIAASQEFVNIFKIPDIEKSNISSTSTSSSTTSKPTTTIRIQTIPTITRPPPTKTSNESNKVLVSSSNSVTPDIIKTSTRPQKPLRRPTTTTTTTTTTTPTPTKKPTTPLRTTSTTPRTTQTTRLTTVPTRGTTTVKIQTTTHKSTLDDQSEMLATELLKTTSNIETTTSTKRPQQTTEKEQINIPENLLINAASGFVPSKIHYPLESLPSTSNGNLDMPPEIAESLLGVLSQVADVGAATTIDYGINDPFVVSSSTTKRSTNEDVKKITTENIIPKVSHDVKTTTSKTIPLNVTSTTKLPEIITQAESNQKSTISTQPATERTSLESKTDKIESVPDNKTTITENSNITLLPTVTQEQATKTSTSSDVIEDKTGTKPVGNQNDSKDTVDVIKDMEKPSKEELNDRTTANSNKESLTLLSTVNETLKSASKLPNKETYEEETATSLVEEVEKVYDAKGITTTESEETTTLQADYNLTTSSETDLTTTSTIIETISQLQNANVLKSDVKDKYGDTRVESPSEIYLVKDSIEKITTASGQDITESTINVKSEETTTENIVTSSETTTEIPNQTSKAVETSTLQTKYKKEDQDPSEESVKTSVKIKPAIETTAENVSIDEVLTEKNEVEGDTQRTTYINLDSTTEAEEVTTEVLKTFGDRIKEESSPKLETVPSPTTTETITTEITTEIDRVTLVDKFESVKLKKPDIKAEIIKPNEQTLDQTTTVQPFGTEVEDSTNEAELDAGSKTENQEDIRFEIETSTITEDSLQTTTVIPASQSSLTKHDDTQYDVKLILETPSKKTETEIERSTEISGLDVVRDTTTVRVPEITKTTTISNTFKPRTTTTEVPKKKITIDVLKKKITTEIPSKATTTTEVPPKATTGLPKTTGDIIKINVHQNEKVKDNKIKSRPDDVQLQHSTVDLEPAPLENLGLEVTSQGLSKDVHRFAELCNELAFRLWASVTSKGMTSSRSLIMSPFAVTSLLAMVFLGARGPTSGQMNDILRLDDMVTFNPHLVFRNVTESVALSRPNGVATAAFVRELYSDKTRGKLLEFYKERVQQFYDGHVEEVNFNAIGDLVRRRTNLLIKRQTRGRIPEYLRGSNIMLRPPLAVFSANVFQTDCSQASTYGRDGEMYFTVMPAMRSRRLVPVPAVVWFSGFLAGYDPLLDATAVSIGTDDSIVSLIMVLPGQQGQQGIGDGLQRLEQRLIESSYRRGAWSRLLRSLLPRPDLELQIPRFSHRSLLNVTAPLQRMGLKDLFSAEHADLRGINGIKNDLHLSDIVQVNTFSTCAEESIGSRHHVEVYPTSPQRSGREEIEEDPKKGTPLFDDVDDLGLSSLPLALRPRQARLPDAPRLKFDRSFLYFVRHNPTGLILHMGRFNPRILH